MKVARLTIKNFRGIKSADLYFTDHNVIIGDNNTGKSTICEALDLVIGPDRLNRYPIINEHDFYNGNYIAKDGNSVKPIIEIEVTLIDLNDDQKSHFNEYIEWWSNEKRCCHNPDPSIEKIDKEDRVHVFRVSFIGEYDPEEDDFTGNTYFSKTLIGGDKQQFRKKDKRLCGFLYLRSLRTARRALSLQKGSLLDIILGLNDIRPDMWEKTLGELRDYNVIADTKVSHILSEVQSAIERYVPREWGVSPQLKISNLTREHLRNVITAFIGSGEGEHVAPFDSQGTGTLNILVLALLSQIAAAKQNVIFVMEEPGNSYSTLYSEKYCL